jgi:hypothetical protein
MGRGRACGPIPISTPLQLRAVLLFFITAASIATALRVVGLRRGAGGSSSSGSGGIRGGLAFVVGQRRCVSNLGYLQVRSKKGKGV